MRRQDKERLQILWALCNVIDDAYQPCHHVIPGQKGFTLRLDGDLSAARCVTRLAERGG